MVVVEGACARRYTRNAESLAVVNVTGTFIIHECWNQIGNITIRGPDVKDKVRENLSPIVDVAFITTKCFVMSKSEANTVQINVCLLEFDCTL